ncbi:hypothetical protein JL721_5581 [Aureococcus anophagefferens]|nr:hypothetical protein JL721_5581 [Aureococcus anophagefferens]
MAASTEDDEARRLAELIGGDSDSDEEETDADRLRMAQLLGRRGISDEASDDDDAPVVTTPALVPRAPPAPPQLVVLPPERRVSAALLERINDRLHALQNDEAVDEDELDLRRDAPVVVESDEDAAVFCRAAALAHDVATAGGCEIEVDFQRRPPFECPARPALARCFVGGPPADDAGLPNGTWRWLSPWQVDSRVHGSDRRSAADAPPDAWLYARAWPPDDVGYDHVEESAKKRVLGADERSRRRRLAHGDWRATRAGYAARPTPRSFVRCRRWVRPRGLDAGKPPSRSHSEEDGLIPIDDPGAPPPPRASNVKLFS